MVSPAGRLGDSAGRLAILLIAAACAWLLAFFSLAGMRRILTVIPDDAGYFFGIAENLARGQGFTFDRLHPTNGFQPLWQFLLAGLAYISGLRLESLFRVGLLFQVLLLAACGLALFRLHRRAYPGEVNLLGAVLFVFLALIPAANGMESAPLLFTLTALFAWFCRTGRGPRGEPFRPGFVLGLLLALVVLARLDTIFLPVVVFSWALLQTVRGRIRAAEFSMCAVGFLLPVAPYLLFNKLCFGAFMPISGMLKTTFPHLALDETVLAGISRRHYFFAASALVYLVWHFATRKRMTTLSGYRTFFSRALPFLAAGVVLHFLHVILFMDWAVFRWHFASYDLFFALAVCEPAAESLSGRRARIVRPLILVCSMLLLAAGTAVVYRRSVRPLDSVWSVAAYDAALWTRQNTAGDAVLAMKDAGFFGYFSDRRVINLDGVVNSAGYQEVLRQKHLGAYLRENGVSCLAQHAVWDSDSVVSGAYDTYRLVYPSRLYADCSDTLTVSRKAEVYRSKPYYDGPYRTVFLIWRFPG
ncbi:MAG: hypothetical protein V1794_09715 [Candidatus Glassbacteria bacterium]